MGITFRKPKSFRSRDCYPLWSFYSRNIKLRIWFITSRLDHTQAKHYPTTPGIQRIWTLTYTQFGLFPFRSPLLGESSFLSVPQVTEMFHFSWLASRRSRDDRQSLPGCPIRGSPDQSLLNNYPKLIAVCHALHRYLAPRHPP